MLQYDASLTMLWIDTFFRCVSNLILPEKQMMSDETTDIVVIDSMGFALDANIRRRGNKISALFSRLT